MTLAYLAVSAFLVAISSSAQERVTYQMPPRAIADIADAAPTPGVVLDPTKRWLLVLERASLGSIGELSHAEHRLAGLRIHPATNARSRRRVAETVALISVADGTKRVESFKPTLYYGVPTLYAAQLAMLENATPDLSSVRYCVSAGEALPADIFRRWKEKTDLIILDGIGSTEALHIFMSNQPEDQRPGTSGHIVPGYEAKIVGDDGKDVPRGEAGTLVIRGDSTARAYWNKPEKTAETMLDDDWLSRPATPTARTTTATTSTRAAADDMMKVGGIWDLAHRDRGAS